jgi:putative transposase
VKAVVDTLGIARSTLIERLNGRTKPRRRYHKAQDAAVLPLVQRLVDDRPTYGYRRVTALLNRRLAAEGAAAVNHKRVYRLMKTHGLLLERHAGNRPGRSHDGKVVVMRSNLRWCSDASSLRAGMARSCGPPSSLMPTTARSSPGRRWRAPGSAAPTSAT